VSAEGEEPTGPVEGLDAPYHSRFGGPPDWTPGPLDVAPLSLEPPYTVALPRWIVHNRGDRADALAGALSGVRLGAYDRVVLHWLTGWDNATVATIVSLIRRARLVAISRASNGRPTLGE
jgi:hypothetical protein